ncbi:hypothetical protein ACLBXO_11980 [Methylobacterium sp. C33D]
MTDSQTDANIGDVLIGLMRLRRVLASSDFQDLLGAVLVEIEQGLELALEAEYRRKAEGNLIPFPGAIARGGIRDEAP